MEGRPRRRNVRSSFAHLLVRQGRPAAAQTLVSCRAICKRRPSYSTLFLMPPMLLPCSPPFTSTPQMARACAEPSLPKLGKASKTALHGINAPEPQVAAVQPALSPPRAPLRRTLSVGVRPAADAGCAAGRFFECGARLSQVSNRRHRAWQQQVRAARRQRRSWRLSRRHRRRQQRCAGARRAASSGARGGAKRLSSGLQATGTRPNGAQSAVAHVWQP